MISRKSYIMSLLVFLVAIRLALAQTEIAITSYDKASEVLWASPDGFDLTMDIYTPNNGQVSYPVIVMFHGGGWLINNQSIMDQSCDYLATHGNYVVCNVNYRLLGDMENSVTMDEIIEDAMGAILWVKHHISNYKGDPDRIIVTGDSAGGHLATVITLQGTQLNSGGFDKGPDGFHPSWLPKGKTCEEIALENGMEVQAAIISYGAFNLYEACKHGFESAGNIFWTLSNVEPRGIFGNEVNSTDHPEYYQKVSPYYQISNPTVLELPPMLFTVGDKDNTTTPTSIKSFIKKLNEAGYYDTLYWEHKNRPHAFLDSGSNPYLGIQFEKDAPPALDVMLAFLNGIFYEK